MFVLAFVAIGALGGAFDAYNDGNYGLRDFDLAAGGIAAAAFAGCWLLDKHGR